MKYIVSILLLMQISNLFAQKIEFYSGINHNYFRNLEYSNTTSSFDTKNGIALGIGIDSLYIDWLRLRLSIQFDNYRTNAEIYSYYKTPEYNSVTLEMQKSIITFNLYPINFTIANRFDLNIGVNYSFLVNETFSGTEIGSYTDVETGKTTKWNRKLETSYENYSNKIILGFQGRLSYNIPINSTTYITPIYIINFGRYPEYSMHFQSKIIHQNFCVGIIKCL